MRVKKIITSGCSFSDKNNPLTWPNQLESYIVKNIDENVKFDHRGVSSQGQELIQKKASHAIYEALLTGYKPEELAVFVMWSSIDRKSFYIDNTDMLKEIFQLFKKSKQGWEYQLGDLTNFAPPTLEYLYLPDVGTGIRYNTEGGWYMTSAMVTNELEFIKQYFMVSKDPVSVQMCQESLENIIFLQNLCELKGIKLYQQWYMDHAKNDILKYAEHQNTKYLYSQLNQNTFISHTSIYNYLIEDKNCFKENRDPHPNGLGHRRWLTEVILPRLYDDDFLD